MAETITLARPYAEAAFRVAREENSLDGWEASLARMAMVAADEKVRSMLEDPELDAETLAKFFIDLSDVSSSETKKNFVHLLAENDRLAVLGGIRDLFAELKNDVEGVKDAHIQTAFALDEKGLAEIVKNLEQRFGCKIQPTVEVDAELIGGVRIAVGDEVIDASVRGKLAQLATALKN